MKLSRPAGISVLGLSLLASIPLFAGAQTVPTSDDPLNGEEMLIQYDRQKLQKLRAAANAEISGSTFDRPNLDLTPGYLCTEDDPGYLVVILSENANGSWRTEQSLLNKFPLRQCGQMSALNHQKYLVLKKKVFDRYNLPIEDMQKYELKHLIPLALGGGNAVDNLWPRRLNQSTDGDDMKTVSDLADTVKREDRASQIAAIKKIYDAFPEAEQKQAQTAFAKIAAELRSRPAP